MSETPVAQPAWSPLDRVLATALGLGALLWLVPRRSMTPGSWDSVLFALALDDYDVGASRPHAPGYPIYVALGRIFRFGWPDANDAFVALSLACTAATAVLIFVLVRRFAGRWGSWPAAAAGVLYLASPAVLYNGVIATSYPADALLATSLCLLVLEARRAPSATKAFLLGALFAFTVGVRQSASFLLAPLVAYGLWGMAGNLRARLALAGRAALAFAVVALLWAVPMVLQSGGLSDYLAFNRIQSEEAVLEDPVWVAGWGAVENHGGRLLRYVEADLLAWAFPLFVAAIGGLLALATRRRLSWPEPAGALAAWAIPPVLFHTLVFSGWNQGPIGYALVFLPALVAAVALATSAALGLLTSARPERARWAGPLAAVVLLAGLPNLAAAGLALTEREVADHDAWAASWEGIRDGLPASNTSILASYSWAHAMWSFPEYRTWSYTPVGPHFAPSWCLTLEAFGRASDLDWYRVRAGGPPGTRHLIPAEVTNVVLFDFQLAGENGRPRMIVEEVPILERTMPNGQRVLLFHPTPDRPAIEDYFRATPNVPLTGEPLCIQP